MWRRLEEICEVYGKTVPMEVWTGVTEQAVQWYLEGIYKVFLK